MAQIFTEKRVIEVADFISSIIGLELYVTVGNMTNRSYTSRISNGATPNSIQLDVSVPQSYTDKEKEFEVQRLLTYACSGDLDGVALSTSNNDTLAFILLYGRGNHNVSGKFKGRDNTVEHYHLELVDNLSGIEKDVALCINGDEHLVDNWKKRIVNDYFHGKRSLITTIEMLRRGEEEQQEEEQEEQQDEQGNDSAKSNEHGEQSEEQQQQQEGSDANSESKSGDESDDIEGNGVQPGNDKPDEGEGKLNGHGGEGRNDEEESNAGHDGTGRGGSESESVEKGESSEAEGQDKGSECEQRNDSAEPELSDEEKLSAIAGTLSKVEGRRIMDEHLSSLDNVEQRAEADDGLSIATIITKDVESLDDHREDVASYHSVMNKIISMSNKVKISSKLLKHYLSTHKAQYQLGLRTGHLNRKSISRIPTGARDICKKKNNIATKTRGAVILIDISGSMRREVGNMVSSIGSRADMVFSSCLSLVKFYQQVGIDCSVIGYASNSNPCHNIEELSINYGDDPYHTKITTIVILKDFGERMTNKQLARRFSKMNIYGATPTGDALVYADKVLEGYDIKSVLCITDGLMNRITSESLSYIRNEAKRIKCHRTESQKSELLGIKNSTKIPYSERFVEVYMKPCQIIVNIMRLKGVSVDAIMFGDDSSGIKVSELVFGEQHSIGCNKQTDFNNALVKLTTEK